MESNENEELSAADALASTAAGREAVARRMTVSWVWDACASASLGIYMALVSYVSGAWTAVVVALWVVAFTAINRERERRSGVVAAGRTRRTFDPVQVMVFVVALLLFVLGIAVGNHWAGAPVVTAILATVVMFVGARRIRRRALARIQNPS